MIRYDENGLSISKFPHKEHGDVRLRIDFKSSTIFIIQDDNFLVRFKKQVKTKNPDMLKRRAKVYLMKFCDFVFPKIIKFSKRGKHVARNN